MSSMTTLVATGLIGRALLAIGEQVPAEMPAWLQIIRELGSFGLIAFIVWWYATKVAPRSEASYIAALALQRQDYLTAAKEARDSYMGDRSSDRDVIRSLTLAMDNLAKAVLENNRQVSANTVSQKP